MKYEVFICYKKYSADDLAYRLREALLDHGIKAFVDKMDIPTKYQASEKWWQFRDNALSNCDTFVMLVTAGFGISAEIIKEIKLAGERNKDIMCFRWFKLKSELVINLGDRIFNTKDIQQLEFSTGGELVRQFFDNYERKRTAETERKSTFDVKKPVKQTRPIVDFEITQSIGNTQVQRILPDVGFNIRNWSDRSLKAWIKIKVLLGEKNLGLISGSKRGGKYLGYYDGKTNWNLNPYHAFYGHFSLPTECVFSRDTLTLVVSTKYEAPDGERFEYLPIAWTFNRENNSWFCEPTGF